MKKMNKVLSMLLIICCFISKFDVTNVTASQITKLSLDTEEKYASVIDDYVDSINMQKWESYKNCFSEELKQELESFPSEEQVQNKTGLLSVNYIQINNIKEIDVSAAEYIAPRLKEVNSADYDGVVCYYIGLDMNVDNESKYYYNGVNFYLFEIGIKDEIQSILGIEKMYNFDRAEEENVLFGIQEEDIARTIVKYLRKGIVLNGNLMAIDTLSKSIDSDIVNNTDFMNAVRQEAGTGIEQCAYIYDGIYEPEIKVYITSTGKVKTMSLFYYSVNVLPNEWVPSWSSEALKAGYIAVKMYGWYNVENTRYPATNYGADVTDLSQNYQRFIDNSQDTDCTIAARSIMHKVFIQSDNSLINISYSAGAYNASGAGGNHMYQYGTEYLSVEQGMNYQEICEYYFPDSKWITSETEE